MAGTRSDKLTDMCQHMLALVDYCKANQVEFGGCGECGSAWLTCEICDLEVEQAHRIFMGEEERYATQTLGEMDDEEDEAIR